MLRKVNVGLLEGLLGVRGMPVNVGGTADTAAICQTCGRIADAEQILDQYPSQYARVLVKHHGAEEVQRFDLGSSNWADEEDWHRSLSSYLANAQWFLPDAATDRDVRCAAATPTFAPTAEGKVFGGLFAPDGTPLPANDTTKANGTGNG